jgi:hypothetical protein
MEVEFPCNGTEGMLLQLTGNARLQIGSRKVTPAGGIADYLCTLIFFFLLSEEGKFYTVPFF